VKPVEHDLWPEAYVPSLRNIQVGISRTEPELKNYAEVRENEALYVEAIARAQRLIYLENQYFTSPVIADALAKRLAEPDGPEVVLVSTARSPSWFDGMTMDTARAEVLFRLEQADAHGRFFAFCPLTKRGQRIIVHSKMAVIDDKLLRIGSANLNNRSQGLDTECDVSAEAGDEDQVAVIRAFRHRTIGHFIGVTADTFAQAEEITGSVGRTIEMFGKERMRALGMAKPSYVERAFARWQLGDPMASTDAWRPWRRLKYSSRGIQGR
jgi:phosphatidylserine/phosphatidylglycerophosphate/cardiolipin synthase-like enzyme